MILLTLLAVGRPQLFLLQLDQLIIPPTLLVMIQTLFVEQEVGP